MKASPFRVVRGIIRLVNTLRWEMRPEPPPAVDPELARRLAKLERDSEICGFVFGDNPLSGRCATTRGEVEVGCFPNCGGFTASSGCGRWRNP